VTAELEVPFKTAVALAAVVRERERQERKCAEKREEGLEWLTCAFLPAGWTGRIRGLACLAERWTGWLNTGQLAWLKTGWSGGRIGARLIPPPR